MIFVRFQGKPFSITVIQAYTLTSNTKEAKVEWFYENLQDLLELKPKKDVTARGIGNLAKESNLNQIFFLQFLLKTVTQDWKYETSRGHWIVKVFRPLIWMYFSYICFEHLYAEFQYNIPQVWDC